MKKISTPADIIRPHSRILYLFAKVIAKYLPVSRNGPIIVYFAIPSNLAFSDPENAEFDRVPTRTRLFLLDAQVFHAYD